ncbi:MAG: hypothetical protein LBH45_05130 [Campylobacteraceae bacterium]|jgi:hypothetical protein|nr:hypothetical protein [Campylobacteraceae bacterium]
MDKNHENIFFYNKSIKNNKERPNIFLDTQQIRHLKADKKLKSKYGILCMWAIIIQLMIINIILICNGMGWLHYSDTSLDIFTTKIVEICVIIFFMLKALFAK